MKYSIEEDQTCMFYAWIMCASIALVKTSHVMHMKEDFALFVTRDELVMVGKYVRRKSFQGRSHF